MRLKKTYSSREVASLTGLSARQLQIWDAGGLLSYGVLYPNLKEENPGKIVSGFGGTFCLVLSFLYILASVVLLAFGAPWAQTRNAEGIIRSVMCLSGFGVLSFGLGWVPLQFGLQRVRNFEL